MPGPRPRPGPLRRCAEPQLVTGALVAALRELVPIDREHLPQAIADIDEPARALETARQPT